MISISQKLNRSSATEKTLVELAGYGCVESLKISDCPKIKSLAPLAAMTTLEALEMADNKQIKDLSPLAALKRLNSLIMSGCEGVTDLGPLKDLPKLSLLYLNDCVGIESLAPLAGLPKLMLLEISRCNKIASLEPLASTPSLHRLNMQGLDDIDDLKPLRNLKDLHYLHMALCNKIHDLEPLASIGSLRELTLRGCDAIKDISPLASLTSLTVLDLSACVSVLDLAPVAALTSLKSLRLDYCGEARNWFFELRRIRDNEPAKWAEIVGGNGEGISGILEELTSFAPLLPLLPHLEHLSLHGARFRDLPEEICGQHAGENVLPQIRSHFADLAEGQVADTEVKIHILGNGSAGKTQLSRRLRGMKYNPSVLTTHGIQLSSTRVRLEDHESLIQLNIWDFGGQEVYHGTHSLFTQGRAVYVILWTPALEKAHPYTENNLEMSHRPLSYWIDYLRAFAGSNQPVIIVQSQCDTPAQRAKTLPVKGIEDFSSMQVLQVSARTGLGLDAFKAAVKEAVRDCLHSHPALPVGVGRAMVRDHLRNLLKKNPRKNRTLSRSRFDEICSRIGGISDTGALLDFLHHSGVVFFRSDLFEGRIVLDQNWALRAIYSLFNRKKILPLLRGFGRFTQEELALLVWSQYNEREQQVFLTMMEGCGICFRAREVGYKVWEYIAPELLPSWQEANLHLLSGRIHSSPATAEVEARFAFLHEGVLRNYLSRIGKVAKDAPIYWKYGCWFHEDKTDSTAMIESRWDQPGNTSGPGRIRMRGWGERAAELLKPLIAELRKLPTGEKAKVAWKIKPSGTRSLPAKSTPNDPETGLKELVIASPSSLSDGPRQIYLSYAWGDDSSEIARKREQLVDGACVVASSEGWHTVRDKDAMRHGDRISDFMKVLSSGDLIITVLSAKYLHSSYCMQELVGIYRHAHSERQQFQKHIIPLVFDDANIGDWRQRVKIVQYWEEEFRQMEQNIRHLGQEDLRLYWHIRDWHNSIGDILNYVNEVLSPRGFDEIVKDNYASLRQMLAARSKAI